MTEVRVGQVWRDNDTRSGERTFRISAVRETTLGGCALVTSLTGLWPGRTAVISLKRLKTSLKKRGYLLVQEAPDDAL